jgi:tetratricopeptide (TPR) repeat protein
VQKAVHSALVILICLLAAGCASGPAPRPLARGFAADAGVADPYADGKRHLAEGNYELAVQRFGQALSHDRRSLDALNGLAIAYTRLGRFDSAENQFERALQIDPISAATLNNYGWSLVQQGRLREARAFLELARRYATETEAPVIDGNLEDLGHARPPALLEALEEGSAPSPPTGPHRLLRMDDNTYHLETTVEPAKPPATPGTAPDATAASIAVQEDPPASSASEAGATLPDPGFPSVTTQDAGAADALPAPAERSRAAEPKPYVPNKPAGGDPIRLWRPFASGAEAGPITTGDEE